MTNSVIRHPPSVTLWLVTCMLLVVGMVLIGGYTRLSGSGLSITEWKPIHGTLPPLSADAWNEEFEAYKTSPQYQLVNKNISLEDFKEIFWPEFIHRLLGRVVGLVFFIPLILFTVRNHVSKRFALRLAAIFALGGLQGLIGWLMVKSGLSHDPHVSHLRLALHLSTALAILGLIEWALLDVVTGYGLRVARRKQSTLVTRNLPLVTFRLWFALLCCQIVLGAFMAGLHAGLIFNTWPTMDGAWVPDGLVDSNAWYNNLILVQFLHRNLAIFLIFSFVLWWWKYRTHITNTGLERSCFALAVILALQFFLGVLTLVKAVPLPIALTHQMVATLVFIGAVGIMHRMCKGASNG